MGRPLGSTNKKPIIDRFNEKWEPEPYSGCWLWTGSLHSEGGYGRIRLNAERGPATKAHRLSWELFRGPIPEGLCVCHTCDTPMCVNPAHLFLGTPDDNNKDRHRKGRTVIAPAVAASAINRQPRLRSERTGRFLSWA